MKLLVKIIRCLATAIWWVWVFACFPFALLALAVCLIMILDGVFLGYILLLPFIISFMVSLLRYH